MRTSISLLTFTLVSEIFKLCFPTWLYAMFYLLFTICSSVIVFLVPPQSIYLPACPFISAGCSYFMYSMPSLSMLVN